MTDEGTVDLSHVSLLQPMSTLLFLDRECDHLLTNLEQNPPRQNPHPPDKTPLPKPPGDKTPWTKPPRTKTPWTIFPRTKHPGQNPPGQNPPRTKPPGETPPPKKKKSPGQNPPDKPPLDKTLWTKPPRTNKF